MMEFLNILFASDNQFIRLSFYAGMLASIAFGIIGTYVVTRKIAYLAGAISHSVLCGIGASLFLQYKFNMLWLTPFYGAVISAVISAVIVGLVSIYAKDKEDAVISAVWVIGMAGGLIFIDLTPGYFEITSYLFGDILLISKQDIFLIAGMDALVLFISFLFYNKLVAVIFDEEFTKLRGVNTKLFYILLLSLTSLTIILMIRIVGILMVIALLTLPACCAKEFGKKISYIMPLAVFFCAVFIFAGIWISYIYNLSTGPVIIIIAGIAYPVMILGSKILKKRL
ncbi:MAG: metal ABC transporter permease [Deltaproteobacteria bacterium]|nr:metal ABC transporter permease [Deltaproteobacteria bacterium]